MNADYASVQEQSGLFAGDEGYQVNVRKHTDLTGGLITSTAQAETEGKNRFETGTLSYSDIENHANYKGSAIGLSGSASIGGGDMPDKVGNTKLMSFGNNVQTQSVDTQMGEVSTKMEGKFSVGQSIGFGYGKDSQSSQTKSGINTSNIIIRDEIAQLEATGKTISETTNAIKTDVTTDMAEQHSGKLENHFDKEKVLKELNIQVKVTQEFRQNAFSTIDAYVLPKQAELRKQIKEAKTEEEKTALYNEIYKLQYQKRLLETVVGIVSGSPDIAITQGTLQLAATKMREETLANSRKFKGIIDAKTGKKISNVSYDSGYFDGVKLGGVRVDLDAICGKSRCNKNDDGSYTYVGSLELSTLNDAINPDKNKKVKELYGETGGFQAVEGGWYFNGEPLFKYKPGSISDLSVESFAGTHDMLGGQIWGWYNELGNTSQKTKGQEVLSNITTVAALPISAPFAMADLMSSDFVEVLFKLGGN